MLVNNSLKGKIGRDFSIALLLETKTEFNMIVDVLFQEMVTLVGHEDHNLIPVENFFGAK